MCPGSAQKQFITQSMGKYISVTPTPSVTFRGYKRTLFIGKK